MLKFINISEFSDQAVWRDPGVSFILQEVICKTCNHCRDIDLCRDEHRMGIDWLCPLCKSPYDAVQLEYMLLDVFYRRTMAYQLQDLKCVKCNEVLILILIIIRLNISFFYFTTLNNYSVG